MSSQKMSKIPTLRLTEKLNAPFKLASSVESGMIDLCILSVN